MAAALDATPSIVVQPVYDRYGVERANTTDLWLLLAAVAVGALLLSGCSSSSDEKVVEVPRERDVPGDVNCNMTPCSQYLGNFGPDGMSDSLIQCLIGAGGDKEAVQECINKFAGNTRYSIDGIIKYVGCMNGSTYSPNPGYDPCTQKGGLSCEGCCQSKYESGIIKCAFNPAKAYGCFIKASIKYQHCMDKCQFDVIEGVAN
jgi:hypothetical protein